MSDAPAIPSVQAALARPRHIAVVGPHSLHTPLSFVNVNCSWQRYELMAGLLLDMKAHSAGEFEAVVVTTAVPEPVDDVLYGTAELAAAGVPVLIVAASDADYRVASAAWQPGAHLFRAAESASPVPREVFPVAVCAPDTPAVQVLQQLGALMERGWTATERDDLNSGRYLEPFPLAADHRTENILARGGRRARISVVLSDKGGVGKTTTAMLAAASIAYRSYRLGHPRHVCVVDLDRQSQLRLLLNYDGPGIDALTVQSRREDLAAAPFRLVDSGQCAVPNLSVLFGAQSSGMHLASRTPDLYEHVLTGLAGDYDHIVLDGSVGVTSDPLTRWAQTFADDVLYVTKRGRLHLGQMDAVYQALVGSADKGGLARDPGVFQVVENMVPLGDDGKEVFDRDWDYAVRTILPDTTRFTLPFTYPQLEDALNEPLGLVNLVTAEDNPAVAPLLAASSRLASYLADSPLGAGPAPVADRKRRWWK